MTAKPISSWFPVTLKVEVDAEMLKVIYEALKVQLQKEVEQGDFKNVQHTAYSLEQIQKELDKWPKQGFSN